MDGWSDDIVEKLRTSTIIQSVDDPITFSFEKADVVIVSASVSDLFSISSLHNTRFGREIFLERQMILMIRRVSFSLFHVCVSDVTCIDDINI